MRRFWALLFFFIFFGNFVIDFKIFIKLSNAFSTFTSLTSLGSSGSKLVFFKILIFRGDILKNVHKEIPLLLASIFPLYTLVLNSEIEKKLTKISFSLRKMQLEDLIMAQSIYNFVMHYFHYLYLKHAYKKWRVSSKNLQNFNRILLKI